jgi:hypothetical protein
MTLEQQLAELRQLLVTDPDTRVVDLVLVNALEELAQVVQEIHGDDPPGLGSV